MNKQTINYSLFVVGCIIGCIATRAYLSKKYGQEIDRMEEEYLTLVDTATDCVVERQQIIDKQNQQLVRTYPKDIPDDEASGKPYTIQPEQFGEEDEYDAITLTYYKDGILADDNDALVENIDFVVGAELLDEFDDDSDGSMFVRNDTLKCDYEILADYRTYNEALGYISN